MNAFQRLIMHSGVITSTLLAGCAVGPDYRAPQAVTPAQWRTIHAASASTPTTLVDGHADLQQWWTRLNDPLLDALVNEAVAGNLDVATAAARVREARGVLREAGGALYPSLNATGGFTRFGAGSSAVTTGSTASTTTSTLGSSGPTNLFQAGFDASWEIDIFGANRRALEAARDSYDAAQWDRRTALLTLIGDVTTRYVQARGYQARLALARETAASQQETARLTRVRYQAGATSGLDAANASGEAQSTLATIPALEASYAQTVHSLAVLTGRTPDALIERMDAPANATPPVPAPALPVPRGVPADTLLARPDVRAAERRYAQYTARVGQAEAARYPRVTLTGTLSTSGTQLGDLARHSSIGWSIGPSVTIPLFDAGRLKAAVDIADAQREQYLIAYRSAVLTALTDVENASVSLAREAERTQSLQLSADAYGEAAKLAHARYESGSTGFLDVLTADRSLYSAQDTLIQSRVSVTTDYIALNKALGGGWDGDTDASVR
ncbi:NodT family efflux transporter outer membrane factor (OMF) lipoprotein [Paraburkholderia bannensis]|uniref:NodT family efflux transporter outer membrane factor (OMF) lipoprotein n=1 Tax=Paraburkholderia bannensis TaxID=765414 RepID=A0A7W9TZV6_9BURK|nr:MULTISPECIES: efflux transporter outer membrane subunit [Paraburkholderia]MBB3258272.1 NodT family efflux transporter outer membrane factor (OMF) lipoprotein [Paraburkholderia sp. WP4_3_2]MBB6103285.1 NodT family efflux transporter outer membrane factor (OMF) lipoprotein [Paraburkholderia bannensis]